MTTVQEFIEQYKACDNDEDRTSMAIEAGKLFTQEELNFIGDQLGLRDDDDTKAKEATEDKEKAGETSESASDPVAESEALVAEPLPA